MNNNNNNKLFSKRIFILLLAKFFLILILVGRLFFLQIKENFYFNRLSERNRTNLIPIIPKRGLIFDNLEILLADNTFLWELLFIKSNINQGIELFLNTLSSIIPLTEDDKKRIIKDYKNNPAYYPILIKQNISQSEIAAVETFSYNLPGVFIRPFYRRNYKLGEETFHLLGYTAEPNNINKTNNNIAGWYVGKSGLELVMDPFLKGEVGYAKYEINAKGEAIRKLDQIPSQQGHEVHLTIDSELQKEIYQLLSDYNSASAVVNDVRNGNVLAMVSYPSIDANLFSFGFSSEQWNALTNSEFSPLTNKAISGLYPPGSTIKSIITLKALQLGHATPDTEFNCKGYIDVGKDRFHCWQRKSHGILNLEEAITKSCDVYFYELAKKFTAKELSEAAYDFGGKQKHMEILTGEQLGKLPNEYKDHRVTLGDLIVSTIGQGTWLVTPLQLSYMTSLIANGGKEFSFNVVKKIEYQNKIIYPKTNNNKKSINYDPEHLKFVREALFKTVNVAKNTGRLAYTNDPTWPVSGKTGTAQVRRITLEERKTGVLSNADLPWNRRDHALFTGFVPFENPRYAITVVIEHGGSGGFNPAIITRKIANLLKKKDSLYEEENNKINKILQNI